MPFKPTKLTMTQPDPTKPVFSAATVVITWTGAESRDFWVDPGTPVRATDGEPLPSSVPMPFRCGACRSGGFYKRVADFTFETSVPQTPDWHHGPNAAFDPCRKVQVKMLFNGGYDAEWLTVELQCLTHATQPSHRAVHNKVVRAIYEHSAYAFAVVANFLWWPVRRVRYGAPPQLSASPTSTAE